MGGFIVIGTYFPGMNEKRPHWEYAVEVAEALSDEKAIIIGDVNTGKHHIDEVGATFLLPEYFDRIEDLGWREACRNLNPEAREYTWYSRTGNGFRLDHAYFSPPLIPMLKAAFYTHAERQDKISDHSGYMIEIN